MIRYIFSGGLFIFCLGVCIGAYLIEYPVFLFLGGLGCSAALLWAVVDCLTEVIQ